MAQMDYFRRPQLAGKNISRLKVGTIRGNVRRSDPDGFSSVPYFPGVVAAQTLNVKLDGTPLVVNFTAGDLNTVIADINTTLGVGGRAYPTDGSVSIQTNTIGTAGSVEVTGGTAAVALGFDVSNGAIRSTGGDVPSTPEGRIGNWFGVGFPNLSENLNTESVTRSLARLSANSDILFSEHMRCDAVPKKVTFTTPEGKYLTPTSPTSVRAFTGYGLLSASTSKEALAPFFFLIDQATNLPPASRVVGVVRGLPAGLPPYANATTWTGGGLTGNVLGQDIEKVSATITSIKNGRILYCAGADFITNNAIAGDFVSITGATNFTPWNNNGYKWVVEQVIDATHIAVRPMSLSELAQMGTTTTEEQPLVELNINITGIEVFGTVSVRTGTFTNDVKLVVDPPIPAGAAYDLWVSQPGDIRTIKTSERQASEVANRQLASDLRPDPNVLLTSPTVSSWSAASVILTSGYARFSGRVVSIPAKTFLAADFSNLGINYVYWDKNTNDVYTTRSHVKVVNSDPTQSPGSGFPADTRASQHLIAEVVKSGANITAVLFEGKEVAEDAANRVITVGTGGQFSKLEDAIHYVNRWAKGNGFRQDYIQFEIVIISDTTIDLATVVNNGLDYSALPALFLDASVKIRGARPDMALRLKNWSSYLPFDLGWSGGGTYIFEDLTLYLDGSFTTAGLFFGRSGTVCIFKNITLTNADFASFGSFSGTQAIFDNCNIRNIKSSFIPSSNATCSIDIDRCQIHMAVTPASAPILFGQAFTPLACKRLTVRDTEFHRLSTDQGYSGEALIGKFGHQTLFDGCRFERFGSNPAAQDSVLFKQQFIDGPLYITNCFSNIPTRCFIDTGISQENYCFVDNCTIYVQPDAGNPGIRCGSLTNCIVYGLGGTSPTLIEAMRECSGNFVLGSSDVAIKFTPNTGSPGVQYFSTISNNRIEVGGGVSILVASNDGWNNDGVTIANNQILVGGTGAIGIKCFSGLNSLLNGTISGNQLRLKTGDGVSNKIGIYARGSCALIGNQVFHVFSESTFTTGHIGIKIDGAGSAVRAIGNTVAWSSGNYTALNIDGTQLSCKVLGNYLVGSGTGSGVSFTGSPSSVDACEVSSNYILNGVSNISAGTFNNNYVGGNVTTTPTNGVCNEISGNTFLGLVTINGQTSRRIQVTNNAFTNNTTFGGTYIDAVGNRFSANLTGGTSSSFISQNIFDGSSALINFYYVAVDMVENVFVGLGSTINILGFPALVDGNRFLGNNLMILNVGDSFSETSAQIYFRNNYCTCTTNLLADYTVTMVIEGNYLGGGNTLTEVDRFNNNFLSIAGSSTATGRRNNDFAGRAPASGNVLKGGGVWSFTGFDFNGSEINKTAGTLSFTDSSFDGCSFDISGSLTCTNVSMSGCSFPTGLSATASGGAGGGLNMSACRLSFLSITVSGSGTTLIVDSSRVGGALTVSGGAGQYINLDGTQITGLLTVTATGASMRMSSFLANGGASITCSDIEGAASRIDGTCTITCAGNTNISSSILGTGTSTITSANGFITGCYLGTVTLVLGAGTISSSRMVGGSIASGHVTGCKIGTSDFTLGVNSSTYAFSDLAFTGNDMVGGGLYINPYVGTVFETQRVVVVGNTFRPNVITPSGPIAAIFINRGRGVTISGNNIFGPGICIDVGLAAQVSDLNISNNYMLAQMGDFSVVSETLTAVSSGFGTLANGTYSYIAYAVYSAGGATGNRQFYSLGVRSNAVTLSGGSPNNGIDLTLAPFSFSPGSGLSFVGLELYRTADGGSTWKQLTSTTFNFLGNASDIGEAGVNASPGIIPGLSICINNTNDRPAIRLQNSYRTRLLGNVMDKATQVTTTEWAFITLGSLAKGTLLGDNHYSGVSGGLTDDGNTGTNEDDTFFSAAATTTDSYAGALASGGTRRP